MSLGDNLKRLRRDKGWNQSELAAKADIKAGHISTIENDESDPKLSTLYKLMKALDCSPNSLLMDVKEVSLSAVLAGVLERAEKLDDESKKTIIDIIDHYCMAKGMQEMFKDKNTFLPHLIHPSSNLTPVLDERK